MNKITHIGRTEARIIDAVIQKVLDNALADFGLETKVNGCSYTSSSVKPRVTIHVQETEDGKSYEKKQWDLYCNKFGLKPEWFGRKVTLSDGNVYEIADIRPRARKNPVTVKAVIGSKRYVVNGRWLRMTLNQED